VNQKIKFAKIGFYKNLQVLSNMELCVAIFAINQKLAKTIAMVMLITPVLSDLN